MKFVILSYLGEQGPRILFQDPGLIDEEVIDKVPLFLNLHQEPGLYVEPFDNYCSANLIFTLPNEEKGGKKEYLQISIIITKGAIDPDFSRELLLGFKDELLKIGHVYKALSSNIKKDEVSREKFDAIRNLVLKFGKSFPVENVLKKKNTQNAKIFVFGLDNAGKTTIINRLKQQKVQEVLPTLEVEISKTLFEEFCIIIYDAPGQEQFRGLWKPYLNMELDALVFVMDIVHRINYPPSKELLFEIASHRNVLHLPLLIIFNKIDLVQPNIDVLAQELDLSKFTNRPVKWFPTSAINNKNITEAFAWLVNEISKRE